MDKPSRSKEGRFRRENMKRTGDGNGGGDECKDLEDEDISMLE